MDTVYFADRYVIFGHTLVHFLKSDAPPEIYRKGDIIDIGCAYSVGRLGCLCLDTKEEIYV